MSLQAQASSLFTLSDILLASDIAFKAIFLVIKAQSRMRKISSQVISCKPLELAINIQV